MIGAIAAPLLALTLGQAQAAELGPIADDIDSVVAGTSEFADRRAEGAARRLTTGNSLLAPDRPPAIRVQSHAEPAKRR